MDVTMGYYGSIYSLSNTDIVEKIGKKLQDIRLKDNITRDELQYSTGIHAKTVGDAEKGKNITLITLIGILRGLNALDVLERLVADEIASPAAMARDRGMTRERATGRRN